VEPFDEFAREQAILVQLESAGRVTVKDLAERFGVSTVTVRKDLDALEQRSLLRRIRGGAVSAGRTDEGAWEVRARHSREAKLAIASAAAELVADGDVIALDSSTTCYCLAEQLVDRRDLVVVTNGMRAAMLLMAESSAMVVLPGGVLRRSAESMVGPIGDVLSGRGRIGKGFFGLVGLSTELGLLEVSAEEAQTKSYLADACDQVYGVFDSSKATRFGLHSFVGADRITALYTDDGIHPDVVATWATAGVELRVAPTQPATVSQLREGST
jgi:DeoR/GlpR family transcriptional regulator of sugar metabolism